MTALGPFEPAPRIAAGVSGGADSMALALLADAWARQRGGSLLALVVDHGLRAELGSEAAAAAARLGSLGIAATVLGIEGLARGPGLAERARSARFAVLEAACAEAGILHLLLGHHAGDQAETLLIRSLGGSGPAGLAGMAPLVETTRLRLLRPLLAVAPARLRATLVSAGVAWIEDPSNADAKALRPRLRLLRRDGGGEGSATAALGCGGRSRPADGAPRRTEAPPPAWPRRPWCDRRASPCCRGQPLPPHTFAALLQMLAGAPFPPATRSVVALAAAPRPATLAGVRLLPAGRLGPGLLAVREACRDGAAGSGAGRRPLGRAIPSRRGGAGAAGRDAGRAGRRCRTAATVRAASIGGAADLAGGQAGRHASRRAASALS